MGAFQATSNRILLSFFEGVFLKRDRCSFEQIFIQDKDENRRFTGGKSRFEDAVMYEKMPKMHFVEFRNTPQSHHNTRDKNNKSEPIPNWNQVRICQIWWSETRNIRNMDSRSVLARNIECEDDFPSIAVF